MTDSTFSIGDVVMLMSGGPSLTVSAIDGAMVTCLWFADDSEEFKTATLPAATLIAVEFEEDEEDDEDETDDAEQAS